MMISVAILPPGKQKEENSGLPVERNVDKHNVKKARRIRKSRRLRSLLRAVKRTEHDNYKEL